MLAPPHRSKRPRSPSPEIPEQLTSPLDFVLKRRKRDDPFWSDPTGVSSYPQPTHLPSPAHFYEYENETTAPNAESSSAPWTKQGIDRRRARQWERLNAPSHSQSHSSTSSHLDPSSPLKWHSQHPAQSDDHRRHQMSSSPIRHQPPDSSPFRSSGQTKVELEWIDSNELDREWGEEYAAQNSVLHDLHLARNQSYTTPDTTLLQTPALPTPTHLQYPDSSGPTPYRTSYFPSSSSSPYIHHQSDNGQVEGDECMEFEDQPDGVMEEEVKRRYEEANRLLAELALVRQRRWGADGGG